MAAFINSFYFFLALESHIVHILPVNYIMVEP